MRHSLRSEHGSTRGSGCRSPFGYFFSNLLGGPTSGLDVVPGFSRPDPARYDRWMDLLKPAEASAAPTLRERDQIDDRFKWDLSKIYPDWDAWQHAYGELNRKIDEFAALRGSLAKGASALLA